MVKSLFRGEMERMEDLRLLRRYAQEGCAASFEAVVRRHIGWVYSSSMRQVGDPELAQDVTQAVFILLARRAGALSDQTILTGWLFNTLRFTAREARRKEARRRKHESRAARAPGARTADAPAPDDIDDQAWEAMAPLLDDAVTALSESDRQAVLLRFYEGRDFAEIAELLGVNEGAARKRVSRAVQRLGRYLKKRGIALPIAALAATLLARASDAAPFGLSESIISTTTGGATLTPLAATLLTRTTRHLLRAKRRLATAVAAGMALLGVAFVGLLVASFFDFTPELAPLESDTPLAWSTRVTPTRPPEPVVLPAEPVRGRLIIETAPRPAANPPTAPRPLVDAAADAAWWVRQWFDPAQAPTPDMQARRAAEDDAAKKTAAANSIDPATGLPRANPNAPKPNDVVESYAQMGGGGGPTVTANTRGGAPVGGELNGATAGSSAHSTSGTTAADTSTATALVQTVVTASAGSATTGGTFTPGPALVFLRDTTTAMSGTLTPAASDRGHLDVTHWHPAIVLNSDIVVDSQFETAWVIWRYGDAGSVPDLSALLDNGTLIRITVDEYGNRKIVATEIATTGDPAKDYADLPQQVRDTIARINLKSFPSIVSINVVNTAPDAIPLTATAVPEPTTTTALLTASLLALAKRRRHRP